MGKTRNPKFELSLIQLVPNMMTIAAICLGITAIKQGFEGKFQSAVQLILLASVLDGLDGRVARLLKSDSKLGAELDSLADVLNFGIAPPFVLYFWALQDLQGIGWFSVQIYVVCCVVRLARFNVTSKSDEEVNYKSYKWFQDGLDLFQNSDWTHEVDRFHLNNDGAQIALEQVAISLFK